MKVQIELFGASRDFSNQSSLHFDLDQNFETLDYLGSNPISFMS